MNNGQYRVVRQLGKGGMGAIYLAANTQAFDRLCVIKEMLAYYEPGEEADARRRFEREAKTLAALKHPGIPDMYGYFMEGGHNYIVMEYIEGENLGASLTREGDDGHIIPGQPRPEDEVLRYGVEICRVLEYLASIQPEPVVHNDIKPANIIIDKNSLQAVLVDFGTAKARYTRDPGGQVGLRQSDVYGTVGYAPPEQYQGRSEPKSDVYALAATLYHLLTDDDPRAHPFKFPKMDEIAADLRLVLEKALSPDVQERLSAAEFRRQLEAVRAARAGTLQPLAFPQGDMATSVTGVLDLALKHWEYARGILYDGSLAAWLRRSLYNPLAADQAQYAVRQYPEEPDAGLDAFLRALSPRLPKPQIRVIDQTLEFGEIEPGDTAQLLLSVVNLGPAGARGEVVASETWLRPAVTQFGLGPQDRKDIAIHIADTDRLKPGQRCSGTITLRLANGASVTVTVQGQIRSPQHVRPLCQPAPQARPQIVAKPQPVAQPRKRSATGPSVIVLAVALLGAIGYFLIWPALRGRGDYFQGVQALQAGDWERARRILARLESADREAVALVGRALDVQMVPVDGGTLYMGRDDGPRDEQPTHPVPLGAYQIGRFEVTNAQYQRFVDETGHASPPGWHNGRFPPGQALHPVVGVTWEDAQAYCTWLSQDLGQEIRLPTEAEWEWAARGEQGLLYPWGDEDNASCRNAAQVAEGTLPVGSYPCGASPFGVLDMAGNAREWTADIYAPYQDPHNPPATGTRRAIRGGSWRSYSYTTTAREHLEATWFDDDLGFRFVRVLLAGARFGNPLMQSDN